MSMADVEKHFNYCDIGEWDVLALSDGKLLGYGYNWLIKDRLVPGNYLGCDKGEMLIMTKNPSSSPYHRPPLDWN